MKHPSRLITSGFLALGLAASALGAVETYQIDPVHSSVGFNIRHFFTKVPGSFTEFSGIITVDRDNLENSSVEAAIEVGNVSTANEKRDNHLRSPDFFDAAKFPTMTFKSKSWKKTGADTFDVTGDFAIKDVTREVVLKVTLLGFGPGMSGAMLSGWEAATTLDRRDFGIAYGQGMVGNDVEVVINVEAGLQK